MSVPVRPLSLQRGAIKINALSPAKSHVSAAITLFLSPLRLDHTPQRSPAALFAIFAALGSKKLPFVQRIWPLADATANGPEHPVYRPGGGGLPPFRRRSQWAERPGTNRMACQTARRPRRRWPCRWSRSQQQWWPHSWAGLCPGCYDWPRLPPCGTKRGDWGGTARCASATPVERVSNELKVRVAVFSTASGGNVCACFAQGGEEFPASPCPERKKRQGSFFPYSPTSGPPEPAQLPLFKKTNAHSKLWSCCRHVNL